MKVVNNIVKVSLIVMLGSFAFAADGTESKTDCDAAVQTEARTVNPKTLCSSVGGSYDSGQCRVDGKVVDPSSIQR